MIRALRRDREALLARRRALRKINLRARMAAPQDPPPELLGHVLDRAAAENA